MIDLFLDKEWLINFISFTVMLVTLLINPDGRLKLVSIAFIISFSVLAFSVFLNGLVKGF